MSEPAAIQSVVRQLLASQRLAVLATRAKNGHPYANLMAFAASDDLRSLLLVTSRATRKYENLMADPRVALLIDSRSNAASDFHEAVALTVVGRAEEVPAEDRNHLLAAYLEKHPHLEGFASSPSCAVFRVSVSSYYLVRQFQQVTELHLSQ